MGATDTLFICPHLYEAHLHGQALCFSVSRYSVRVCAWG